jgi:hypothetical protein
MVDTPGTYIVTQYLMAGCAAYATDTIQILPSMGCIVLPGNIYGLRGTFRESAAHLSWNVANNQLVQYFLIQRSADAINFTTIGQIDKQGSQSDNVSYAFTDDLNEVNGSKMFYRIILSPTDNSVKYSNTISLSMAKGGKDKLVVFPNPANDVVQLQLHSASNTKVKVDVFNAAGKLVLTHTVPVQRGNNTITIEDLADKPRGIYLLVVNTGEELLYQKVSIVP